MKASIIVFLALTFAVCLPGCPVGKLNLVHRDELINTLREFWVNWDQYHIHYIQGPFPPGALIYDPKSDDRTISVEVGKLITDHDALAQHMKEIKRYGGVVYRIRGQDNWFFGYMYTARDRSLSTTVEGEKSLRVHSLRDVHGSVRR